MKTSDIFLKHVVPACGTLIGIGMYASPLLAVLRVRGSRILGELNPLPYPLAYANSAGWVVYALVLQDWYVFAPNAAGLLLGLFNTLSTIPYARRQVQDWMSFIVIAEAALIMFVGAGTVIPGVHHSTQKTIWGVVAVVVLFPYYFAPLTTLRQVIVHRDSSTLYWPLCLMNLLCATLWFIYGMAIPDWFIGGPNGVGAAFSLVSFVLCFVFPRTAEALAAGHGQTGAATKGAASADSLEAVKDPDSTPQAAGIVVTGSQNDVQDAAERGVSHVGESQDPGSPGLAAGGQQIQLYSYFSTAVVNQ